VIHWEHEPWGIGIPRVGMPTRTTGSESLCNFAEAFISLCYSVSKRDLWAEKETSVKRLVGVGVKEARRGELVANVGRRQW
jgi:hypothetical protein